MDAVDVTRQVTREQQGKSGVWTRVAVSPASVRFENVAGVLLRSFCWAAEQCCDRFLLGLIRIRRSFVDASVSRGTRLSASLVCCFWKTLKVSSKKIKQKQHV